MAATATVKKGNFKQTLKEQTKKAKENLKKSIDKANAKIVEAKATYKETQKNIKIAKKIGYATGADVYDKLPKGKGVINSATNGFKGALKDSAQKEKLNKRLKGGK